MRRPAILPPPSPIFAEFLKRARNFGSVNGSVGRGFRAVSTVQTAESKLSVALYRIPRGGSDLGSSSGDKVLFNSLIQTASSSFGLPSSLVKAVVRAESAFDVTAISPQGARGLMQLMPGTARSLGVDDPFNPEQNIRAGVEYLSRQLDRFGSVPLALAAYNAGPDAVLKYGGVPPYEETRNYISRVLAYQREFATEPEVL